MDKQTDDSVGTYRTEHINKMITGSLIYYVDHIRNYRELTEEMLETIKGFDDTSKMTLIREYNIVIQAVNCLLG
jgi:hypothetical protein